MVGRAEQKVNSSLSRVMSMKMTWGDLKQASKLCEADYREAMAALIAMLDDRLRSGLKAVEDEVRRQQIGSGMRGDKRRTYRFQDDQVVDHVTGKSIQASKAMRVP
jgi:protein subunit release factor A